MALLTGCASEPPATGKIPPHIQKLAVHEDDHQHHENELLVINPPPGYEKTLPEMGVSIIDITTMSGLGLKLYHLQIEDDAHPFQARQAHQKRHPGVVVDVHHHFEQHASKNKKKIDKTYTGRRAAKWSLAPQQCGGGIRIGMVDGAVDTKHPAFNGRNLTYQSFHLKKQKVGSIRHGTAVANVIIGNRQWGGLLPEAALFAANVFHQRRKGKSRASTKSILRAVSWLVEQQVEVINFSIGGARNKLIEEAIRAAHKKGIVMVASAGNSGPFTKKKSYPGAYLQTIAIAATDRFERLAKFSSAGSYVEFTAPGVSIWTAVPGGGRAMSGTSFSSPIVASFVAAALKSDDIDGLVDVRKFLRKNSKDRGTKGWDKYTGWGLVSIKPLCKVRAVN